jgi:hypothetical protein
MKFRKLLFNRIESDAGFRVKIRIFSGYIEYREGDHTATIGVDSGAEVLALISSKSPIRWKPPYATELVSEQKRKEILDNVVAALRFRKISVELI